MIVAGVHRSGTSAVTRVLNLLGLGLTRADDMMHPTPDNTSGHWESFTLMRINDRLLARLGAAWWCPPARRDGMWTTPAHRELASPAAAALGELHPVSPWVWKDPRLCITLPFWRPLLPDPTVVVLVLRRPGETAASLAGRGGGLTISREVGVALWERSLQHLLPALDGLPVAVVWYHDLLADPRAHAERLRDFVTASMRPVQPAAPIDEIAAFIDSGMQHHSETGAMTGQRRALLDVVGQLPPLSARFRCPALPLETPANDRLFVDQRMTALAAGALRPG